MVYRVYVEKRGAFAVEAGALKVELERSLGIRDLGRVRIAQRYDIEGIDADTFECVTQTVLSEAPVDSVYYELPGAGFICAVEYLPGQFDQRADSAAECIRLVARVERPRVLCAKVYMFDACLDDADKKKIESYLINPVDSRRSDLAERETLQVSYAEPADVEVIAGFTDMAGDVLLENRGKREGFIEERSLAMDADDLALCARYFKGEGRNPTEAELRVIDTYWSDHCRHTTFNTVLDDVQFVGADLDDVHETYARYLEARGVVHAGGRAVTLMDIATIGAGYLSRNGALKDWDVGTENNACSIRVRVDNDGVCEDWLLLFKNETHNHPTEIEPFGGAATCIGGAIRDPLSGRAYVYQAMRVTGAGGPFVPAEDTPEGKLPQRRLITEAAHGYSSYGNQVGVATGLVREFYHPGYAAKRLEIGAVMGAVPAAAVRREVPVAGDVVVLVGGRTGRDGCGGAAGSSKAHKRTSLESCGAEVQKGNPPVERCLQRFFRDRRSRLMIKRCNDFGAGGVAVAVGELADGLSIDLDAVPKKYEGLNGVELAISESQERMAVVLDAGDAEVFIERAAAENMEAAVIARVTDDRRLVMKWRGRVIVDISRDFLNSNGAEKHRVVRIVRASSASPALSASVSGVSLAGRFAALVSDVNVCCANGLFERFDSTIGSGSVLMPAGGLHQLTPSQVMAAKFPVESETSSCAGMAFGFDPYVSELDPYGGAYLAVLESAAKLVAAGFPSGGIYFSFQEYFPRLQNEPERWGLPFAALLGAFQAQLDLGMAAIGGKDSMSGSFENLDVPPTLVSFAVSTGRVENIIGGEFKKAGHEVLWVRPLLSICRGVPRPDAKGFSAALSFIEDLVSRKKVVSVYVVTRFGAAEALFKMGVGNGIGLRFEGRHDADALFGYAAGSFIIELNDGFSLEDVCSASVPLERLGTTTVDYTFELNGESIDMKEIQSVWEAGLEGLFPRRGAGGEAAEIPCFDYSERAGAQAAAERWRVAEVRTGGRRARPRALIPVFSGTNCEYDTARALRAAGAEAEIFVVRNLNAGLSVAADFAEKIKGANMIVIPGGFSGGDEPDGSAKFIAAFFRAPVVADAVMELLENRGGLMLGICNGFQALIKLGLVPFGRIKVMEEGDPTLTFNTIGRHQSMLVRTRVCSVLSPWFLCEEKGAVHTIPVSHGEGRFAAREADIRAFAEAGQIAAQYVGIDGRPSMDLRYNPAGSMMAVEALSDPSGRVLGKMGHSERRGDFLYKNVPGNKSQKLFEGGVKYFAG